MKERCEGWGLEEKRLADVRDSKSFFLQKKKERKKEAPFCSSPHPARNGTGSKICFDAAKRSLSDMRRYVIACLCQKKKWLRCLEINDTVAFCNNLVTKTGARELVKKCRVF